MRLYCLASISRIPPDGNYIRPTPYDSGAEELAPVRGPKYHGYLGTCDRYTLGKLPSDYRLTEICIGYKTFEEDETRKIYDIEIYQTKSDVICFRMLRGFVTISSMEKVNGCFDLCLATSKLPERHHTPPAPDFDLKIRVFCIKNTKKSKDASQPGIITSEEESAYNEYAEQISSFWNKNPHITADNLRTEVL